MKRIVGLLSFLFVVLATLHLLSARPFWLDEEFVMQSLLSYDLRDFFGVLKVEQAFPRVYLVCIWFLGQAISFHPIVMRILPFIAMIGAFFLWLKIYKCSAKNSLTLILVCLYVSVSWCFVYYAAELKPYSMDVLTAGIVVWICLYFDQIIKRPVLKYCVAFFVPCMLFFSYTMLFFIWMIPYKFLLSAFHNKKGWMVFWVAVMSLAVVFSVEYLIDIRYSQQSPTINAYWKSYFLSTASIGDFLETFFEGFKRLSAYWMGKDVKWMRQLGIVFIPLYLYGLFGVGARELWREKFKLRSIDSIGFVLFLELVVLGILHKYPFTGSRITLFMAPFIFYSSLRAIENIPQNKLKTFLYGYCTVYALVSFVNLLMRLKEYLI